MSRFGYSTDVGKDLEREREHIRKIEEELGPMVPGQKATAHGSAATPPERKDATKMDASNYIPRNSDIGLESAAPKSTTPHNPDPAVTCNCADCVHRRTILPDKEGTWWIVAVIVFVLAMLAVYYFTQ